MMTQQLERGEPAQFPHFSRPQFLPILIFNLDSISFLPKNILSTSMCIISLFETETFSVTLSEFNLQLIQNHQIDG